jgi:urease accessory protein
MTYKRAILAATTFGAWFCASVAEAHTGHGTSSFYEGVIHPFGVDHLLAMVAVGIWSVSALPANKVWLGPLVFLSALTASAALGMTGLTLPYLEQMISMSVVLFGAMLWFACQRVPAPNGLVLTAVAAFLHGLAHGAETPATGFAGYVAGFLLTTAVLHGVGLVTGIGMRRYLKERESMTLGGLGVALGVAGLYLLAQT